MEKIRWIGIDGGESAHQVVLLSEDGKIERSVRISNRRKDLESSLRELSSTSAGESHRVVVEGRKTFSYLVVQVALECGLEVWEVATSALEQYRRIEGPPRKDGELDAYLLALMGYKAMGLCRRMMAASFVERQLSRLVRHRSRLVQMMTRCKQQLRSLVLELSPELLSKQSGAPSVHSKRLCSVLRKWPGLEGLERAQTKTIERELRSVPAAQKSREARVLRSLAREVVMPVEEREVVAMELDFLLEQMEGIQAQLGKVATKLEGLVVGHELGPKLVEMPGVGLYAAAVELSEILPLARHSRESQVATYAGVTPLSRQSGKSHSSRLSRGSNKLVLSARYLSALTAIKVSEIDRAYYEKKRLDYKGHPAAHTKALLSLARQRSKVLYRLMTTAEVYDHRKLLASTLRRKSQQAAAFAAN